LIIHELRIPYHYGDSFRLKSLFDIHWGNTYCDTRALKDYLADSDDKTYFIGGGDWIDAVVTKDIKRYMKHSDATETDAILDEQEDGLGEVLAPYKDKIIGGGDGNHEHSIIKYHGHNPMRRMSEKLGFKYLGYSWFVRLVFSEDNSRTRTVVVYGHHGWGGGSRTAGGELTKYDKVRKNYEADIYMFGHGHRLQSSRSVQIGMRGKGLYSKPKYTVLCGSFLKTLSETTDATYSEVAGYPPIEVGGATITIKPDGKWAEISSDV